MDKKARALELLRKTLNKRPDDTRSFEQWRRQVLKLLKTCGFGDDDVQWFEKASSPTRTVIRVIGPGRPTAPTPDEYDLTTAYETLQSILEKNEYLSGTLGSDTSQDSGFGADGDSHIQLFDSLRLHHEIVAVSRNLFADGHYAQAILDACKVIDKAVQQKSGLPGDGKGLMGQAVGSRDPVIKLNEGVSQSERDEQEGFMHLFMGTMQGIRNPKAHDLVTQTDPYLTLEYLGLTSLLMKKISSWEAE